MKQLSRIINKEKLGFDHSQTSDWPAGFEAA